MSNIGTSDPWKAPAARLGVSRKRYLDLVFDLEASEANYRRAAELDRLDPISFPPAALIIEQRSAAIDAAADLAQCLKDLRSVGPLPRLKHEEATYRARLSYALAQWKAAKAMVAKRQVVLMAAE